MEWLADLGILAHNAGSCMGQQWLLSERRFASINPTTGGVIATAGACTSDDYERVMAHAAQSASQWQMVPAPKRGELVRRIGDGLRQSKSALGTLISLETGKIKQEGEGEVQEMIDIADLAVGQSRMLYGKTMHSERPDHRLYEQWHPLGAIGVITAFNFPAAVWAWNALIAAVCGNTVVWKPSPKAPLTAIAIQHIVNRAMQELGTPGVFSLVLTDDDALAERLIADVRMPLISFTGSSQVGKHVAQVLARRMGRCLLECSGNNAVIVDESADLELAIRAILFGAVGTSGQRCTTTRRLIVHESRYDTLIRQLIEAFSRVRIGNPLDEGTLMGPLIDQAAQERFRTTVMELRDLGAQIMFGGETLPGPGYFVQPTLVRAQPGWDIVRRETFAPILYVLTFSTLAEAIHINNDVPQGLSSALITNNLQNAEHFLSAMGSDCGMASINTGTAGAEIGGAFGGEKETGGGREAGSDAWKAYMRRQTVTINWGQHLPLAQGIRFTSG